MGKEIPEISGGRSFRNQFRGDEVAKSKSSGTFCRSMSVERPTNHHAGLSRRDLIGTEEPRYSPLWRRPLRDVHRVKSRDLSVSGGPIVGKLTNVPQIGKHTSDTPGQAFTENALK